LLYCVLGQTCFNTRENVTLEYLCHSPNYIDNKQHKIIILAYFEGVQQEPEGGYSYQVLA